MASSADMLEEFARIGFAASRGELEAGSQAKWEWYTDHHPGEAAMYRYAATAVAEAARKDLFQELRAAAQWTLLYRIPEHERIELDRSTDIPYYEMSHLIDWLTAQEEAE